MPNSIELIKRYAPETLDEIFVKDSVTGILENRIPEGLRPKADDKRANIVYIPDLTMSGLGDYDRTDGFPMGNINVSWNPYTVKKDRGRGFTIDYVEDMESAGIVAASLMKEFMRTKVIPEVDSYRLSTLYSNAVDDHVVNETIAANSIISKFNTAIKAFQDNEIPYEDSVLFVSTEIDKAIRETSELQRKISQADYKVGGITFRVREYDQIPIVTVPPTRFKTSYIFGEDGFTPAPATYELTKDEAIDAGKTYYTRSGEEGAYVYAEVTSPNAADIRTYYEKTFEGAADINFMLVHFWAALPYKKHEAVRVFAPEQNQKADAWLFQYRLYHDIWTHKNKTKGIYVSVKTAV